MRRSLALALLLLATACSSGTAYVNGRWLDGDAFVAKPMYVVDGRFRAHAPHTIKETVDLHGNFVLPPLAEAHNHWLEPDSIDDYIQNYLRDGVFYVMDQANVPQIAARVRAKTNQPSSVDYRVALLGFTGPAVIRSRSCSNSRRWASCRRVGRTKRRSIATR